MEKINLTFDATILANSISKNASRSGIFFTSYQIAKHLMSNSNINLSFFCSEKKQTSLRMIHDFQDIPVYPYVSIFDTWYVQMRTNKQIAKRNNKLVKKIFWHYLLFFTKLPFNICNFIIKKLCQKFKVESELFLSPMFSPINGQKSINSQKRYILLYDAIPLLYPEYYPQIKNGKYWLLDVVNCLKSDSSIHAFAISEQTKKDFLKFVPGLKSEQITVTPLACSDAFHPCSKEETLKSLEKYNLPTDKRYVFSLCSLEPRKNLIRAVKTFIEFIKKNKIEDMVFILGGGHWEDFIGKLDKEIEGLGEYKNKIIKAGYIDDEDLAPLYSGAEWFVYTSQYEGFGLPPLEAMACGCPVITSNNSSLPEVVGDAGIMIDWDSDEQHIRAYEDYYFHPELRDENHQKGLERAKQFSWDKTVDLMIKEMMK